MLEKFYKEVPSQSFTANGTSSGVVTVSSTAAFRLHQLVVILNPSLPSVAGEIKVIYSDTQMAVGPQGPNPNLRIDLSAYGTSSTISAPEQQRPAIATQDIERYTYEEAPVVARRTVTVDDTGNVIKFVRNSPGEAKSLGVSVDNLSFTPFKEAKVSDSFQGAAQGQALIINVSPMEAKGGAVSLSNRKGVFIMPIDKNLHMGFSSSVTAANGIPIFINQMIYVPATANMQIWLVSSQGTAEARVWEVG